MLSGIIIQVSSNRVSPASYPSCVIRMVFAICWEPEPTRVPAPPTAEAIPAAIMTILERMIPFDLAATAAIIGIQVAIVPEFDKTEDMRVQQITTTMVKTRSFFANRLAPMAAPSLSAIPVWNRESPTTHMPATIITVLLEKPA